MFQTNQSKNCFEPAHSLFPSSSEWLLASSLADSKFSVNPPPPRRLCQAPPQSSFSAATALPKQMQSSPIYPSSAATKPDQLSPLFTVFEDLIHGMIVQRCEPVWLPFVPGYSFWVPSRPQSGTFLRAVEKLSEVTHSLSDEETMAPTTIRGWPSSVFFLHGKGIDLEKVGLREMADKDYRFTDFFASEDMND